MFKYVSVGKNFSEFLENSIFGNFGKIRIFVVLSEKIKKLLLFDFSGLESLWMATYVGSFGVGVISF